MAREEITRCDHCNTVMKYAEIQRSQHVLLDLALCHPAADKSSLDIESLNKMLRGEDYEDDENLDFCSFACLSAIATNRINDIQSLLRDDQRVYRIKGYWREDKEPLKDPLVTGWHVAPPQWQDEDFLVEGFTKAKIQEAIANPDTFLDYDFVVTSYEVVQK